MHKLHDMRSLKHPAVWYSLKLTGRKTPSNYVTVISEMARSLRTPILPERFPVTYRESQHAPENLIWLLHFAVQRCSYAEI